MNEKSKDLVQNIEYIREGHYLMCLFSVGSKKVYSKFGVYKVLVFREILAHSSNFRISDYQIETFNHAESTSDAQGKQACSYELAFTESKKFINSKFGAHLF
jgi:hypothetical protein